MARVPLPFRGVAVLLLTASTVVGQTPEPPAELPLDPLGPSSPEFLRQFSTDTRHPLLNLMVDGELTSFDATPPPESSKIKPTPQSQSASSSKAPADSCPLDCDGSLDGCPLGIECPTIPNFLPYACPPPPCYCRKCQRKHCHAHCGGHGYGYGPGYGNPYLGWPCPLCCYGAPLVPCQGCCGRRCHHKHGCGYNPYLYPNCSAPCGCGYGGGWNMMGGDGFLDDGFCGACAPFMPPPTCHCRKCQRKHGCGQPGGYGCPYGGGYGGGWGMGYGGFLDGGCCGGCMPFMAPPPPPPCHCHKCQRKHGCSYGYGYVGCGYPGWPAYPVPGACMADGYDGCGKHHGLFHRCRGCHHQPPYPYYAYPMMPCMAAGPFCADCAFGGDCGLDSTLGGTCD